MWQIPRKDKLNSDQLLGAHEFLASQHRSLFLYGEMIGMSSKSGQIRLDIYSASYVSDCIMAMALESPGTPIKLFIDSPGGDISVGLRLIDIISTVPAPIWTIGMGCYSMAAMVLAAGKHGRRYMLPNSQTMLHLPLGNVSGDQKQIDLFNKEMVKTRDRLVRVLIEGGVKKTEKEILKDIDRELFMDAQQTISYGLADKVVDAAFWKNF